MAILPNQFVEPGVFSQFQPTTNLPVIPGGIRVAALIGKGRLTNLVSGEVVTKGTVDGQDSLANTAVSLSDQITDENFVVYTKGVDYLLTAGQVDWSPSSSASITGTETETFNGLVGTTIILTVDGGTPQTYTFVTGDFAVDTAATAAEVATAISANITGVTASDSAGQVQIDTDATNNASLLVGEGTSNSILGFTAGSFVQSPKEPATGVTYTVDYEFNKVAADYTPRFFFNMNSVVAEHGEVSTTNTLSLGAEIVFQQGASAVALVQVDPADGAELTQFQKALDKLLTVTGINIVVPLSTDTNLHASVKNHVNTASSLTERKERIAVLGLGGSPTVSAVVSIAQGLADKRVSLVYPASATRLVGAASSASTLDGSFLAAAIAGIRVSANFDVAEPLTRKEPVGFISIPDTLLRSEKNQLSANGVMVIETVSGISRVRFGTTTDPSQVSTREISVVEIIDFVASSMRELLEAVFIGQKILADTPSQVRSTVSAVLQDLIRREILVDVTDIQASIDSGDPTQINVSFKVSPVFPLNFVLVTFSLQV